MIGNFDLEIIVLNYNGKNLLEKLLSSLRSNYLSKSSYNITVTVVDNCSSDDSVLYLRSLNWVKIIESDKNGGFAYGNNLALKISDARYVMLLNSDTEIPDSEGNLDILIDYMDSNEKAAVITPKINLTNGQLDKACHRGEPTPWVAFCHFSGLGKLFSKSTIFAGYHQSYKDLNVIHIIDACTGAAMLIRRSAIEITGLLDERFFMYAEDIDWCRRFRENGFEIIFNPNVTVIHHKYKSGLQSADYKTEKATRKWFYETMLQYYDKHYASKPKRLFRFIIKNYLYRKIS